MPYWVGTREIGPKGDTASEFGEAEIAGTRPASPTRPAEAAEDKAKGSGKAKAVVPTTAAGDMRREVAAERIMWVQGLDR